MKALFKRISCLFAAAAAAVPLAAFPSSLGSGNVVRIGILDTVDPWFYVQTFAPTMDHLRASVPGRQFRSIELSFDKLRDAAKNGAIDFFIAPSGFFAFVSEESGAIHMATRHPLRARDPGKAVGSAFVVRASGNAPDSIAKLRGKTVAAVDRNSFDGWVIASGEILRKTGSAENFFGSEIFRVCGKSPCHC
ncbi:MAG: PhnD/SsuA/transferrin family substrate-binding protein [Sutterellaceae bacterium]|nr:PhnD/SsuA/transferrin family substrate-binding protein [Sutterellaceae bacterium]MDY2867855.1 PhnD/SsuA/transferrin family substrate-binding protein [Mesosutterella sp.]